LGIDVSVMASPALGEACLDKKPIIGPTRQVAGCDGFVYLGFEEKRNIRLARGGLEPA